MLVRCSIRRISPNGNVTTLAGMGDPNNYKDSKDNKDNKDQTKEKEEKEKKKEKVIRYLDGPAGGESQAFHCAHHDSIAWRWPPC